jgi:glycosyltransferase involved in cell wall biosynthesis
MRILMLTTVLPGSVSSGGEVASQAFADGIRALGHDVVVLGYRRPGTRPPMHADDVAVADRPIETAAAPARASAWMAKAVVTRRPYSVTKYVSRRYAAAAREQLRRLRPQLTVVDHAQMAWAAPEAPYVYLAHNVEHQLYAGLAGGCGWSARASGREAQLMRRVEERLCRGARAVWALADADAELLGSMAARAVAFDIPVDVPPPAPAQPSIDIALLGSWTWKANAAGLEWFLRDVRPLLPEGVSVEIAGSGSLDVPAAVHGVTVRGRVPDAAAFLQSARAVAVPSVAGGGLQIKTLDAIASGRPVVATPVATRGIANPPTTVAVAADGAAFARELGRALASGGEADGPDAARRWARERAARFREQLRAALEDA